MTNKERLQTFLRSLTLGPLVLYHGVEDGHCDCGDLRLMIPFFDKGQRKLRKHNRAKHPWLLKWQETATYDEKMVRSWLLEHPFANFAVLTGLKTVVLDLDVREGKDGIAELYALATSAHQNVPATVSVISGSGATHLYFNVPLEIDQLQKPKGTKGIDFQGIGKAAIAPGSRHINGNYYRFVPGLSPSEVAVANVPDWLLATMMRPAGKRSVSTSLNKFEDMDQFFDALASEGPPEHSMQPGRLRSDEAVAMKMKTVPMCRYPDDRSHSDSHWAWTLSRYCCHHWVQFVRIWRNSPIRRLSDTRCGDQNYERNILRRAFSDQRQQWVSKPLQRPTEQTANPTAVRL
jgi:hypothetical protein